MKISYRYTFSQFSDNFIAQYYSGGIRVFSRILIGPALILIGVLFVGKTRQLSTGIGNTFLFVFGILVSVAGLLYFLRPVLQLLIVRLRKNEIFGDAGQEVQLILNPETQSILINDGEGESELALTEILYIQHRSESSWIITNRDQTIPIPRNELLEGDHDDFIAAIEAILDSNEQKH